MPKTTSKTVAQAVAAQKKLSNANKQVMVTEYGSGQQTYQGLKAEAIQTPVERLYSMGDRQVNGGSAPEPQWEFTLTSVGQGVTQVDEQLQYLNNSINSLQDLLRHHMPDCLYDCVGDDGAVGYEGYSPAGNLNSPTLHALAHLGNQVANMRRSIQHLCSNIVL